MSRNKEPSDWLHLNQGQYAAALCAKKEAGEYIESIGKTDLATYTKEEFETLVLVICNAMNEHDTIPF
jgi:hypothetical protein